METRVDRMGFGTLQIKQISKEFCYGVDAVLLADFTAKHGKNIKRAADLGSGSGAVSLILTHKTKVEEMVAIEVQEKSAKLARENVKANDLDHRMQVICSNILDIGEEYYQTFDTVVSNPPYMVKGASIESSNSGKRIARHETTATLEDFLRQGEKLLQKSGNLFMVHRPSRLVDLVYYGRLVGLELKTLRLVKPKEGKSANIVLLHYTKGGGKELALEPDLILYDEKGDYSEEVLFIYEKEKID